MAYIYDLVDTWNNAAVTFTAIKMNVTDTNSAAGSLLIDLQVGGANKFRVDKFGNIITNGDSSGVQGTFLYHQDFYSRSLIIGGSTQAQASLAVNTNGVSVSSTKPFGFGVWNAASTAALDTILTRRGAANFRLGAADAATAIAQTLSVQSVVAGTSNQPGANLTITGSQSTGNAAGGSIIFQVAPAGSSGTAQNALATALTINSNSQIVAGLFAVATPAIAPAGSLNSGIGFAGSSGSNVIFYRSGGSVGYFDQNGFRVASSAAVSWGLSDASSGLTTALWQDAANTLALRNGTNAQTFRVYNTWTSFGTGTEIWERGKFAWESNILRIGTEKGANGGTARALEFQTDGTTRLTIETNGDLTVADAENIVLGSTTGTKIATANTQKLGFWNATPIVQPNTSIGTATTASTGTGDVVAATTTFDGYTIPQIVKALRVAGLLA